MRKIFEYIMKWMEEKNIDAYILQETHLERDYTKTLNNRYLMVYHGPIKQPRSGAKGRVAIILSREFDEVWRRTGNTLWLGGISAGNTARLMGLDIDLKL